MQIVCKLIYEVQMKPVLLLFIFFLTSCSYLFQETPKYTLSNSVLYTPEKGKSFFVDSSKKSVEGTKLKIYLKDYLKSQGYKIVEDRDKAQYILTFTIDEKAIDKQRTVPVFGKTNVRSIDSSSSGISNTSLYGSSNRYGSTTSLYGNSNTSYLQNTHQTVNYEYGVTGYKTVIDHYNIKHFDIDILDNKTQDVISSSNFATSQIMDYDLFISYIQSVYNNLSMFTPLETYYYDCRNGVCVPIRPAKQ